MKALKVTYANRIRKYRAYIRGPRGRWVAVSEAASEDVAIRKAQKALESALKEVRRAA